MSTEADSNAAQLALGVSLTPGLGQGYPELKNVLNQLYSQRVAGLPWVTSGWLGAVTALQMNNPGDLVVVAPSNGRSGAKNAYAPTWQNDEQRKAWTKFALDTQDAIGAYAAGQEAAGKAQLDMLIANAAFWDEAYNIAVSIRDAVPNAAGALTNALWAGLGTKWKVIIGLGVLGIGLYFALPFIKGAKALKGITGK